MERIDGVKSVSEADSGSGLIRCNAMNPSTGMARFCSVIGVMGICLLWSNALAAEFIEVAGGGRI